MRIDRRSFVTRTALAGAAAALGFDRFSTTITAAVGQDHETPHPPKPGKPARVRLWCEGTAPKAVYPSDIDGALGDHLGQNKAFVIAKARLDDPEAGLADAALDATDVLVWWGRLRHDDVPADRVEAIVSRVKAGRLGFVALHASYASRPFRALMGTPCEPGAWRNDGRPEHIEVKAPSHPIARGVAPFTIPKSAMYAEPFAVPAPETVVFVSSWDRGETFRSGLTWTIGQGRVVYFRPGHDSFPDLFHPCVRQVVANSVAWAAPRA